jgi:3-oxoacyl-[acyl-carrier protein] reductase
MAITIDLAGQVALVTGGTKGVGRGIAQRLADAGAVLAVCSRSEPDDLPAGWTWVSTDLRDGEAAWAMVDDVVARLGRLDVLVNNAGISGVEGRPEEVARQTQVMMAQLGDAMAGNPASVHLDVTVATSDEDWHRVLAVHLDGTFFCTREAVRIMGPQGSGAILNLGSIMGTTGGAGAPAYCTAKSGILGLTRSHARELVSQGIRVNAIAPGWIDTAMTEALGPMLPVIAAQTPMGRLGEPDDIAWAAVYLASDEAKFVTGQVLSPNGGWYMSQ